MIDLALLHTLRDIGIGLLAVGFVAFLLWLQARYERNHLADIEREDLEDFKRHFPIAQTRDWEFPERWIAPTSEYVAKPKERIR
jgi:hypothetical protein